MYQELWDRLPGDWRIKLFSVLALLVLVVALLLEVVFPWVGPLFSGADVQVVG